MCPSICSSLSIDSLFSQGQIRIFINIPNIKHLFQGKEKISLEWAAATFIRWGQVLHEGFENHYSLFMNYDTSVKDPFFLPLGANFLQ